MTAQREQENTMPKSNEVSSITESVSLLLEDENNSEGSLSTGLSLTHTESEPDIEDSVGIHSGFTDSDVWNRNECTKAVDNDVISAGGTGTSTTNVTDKSTVSSLMTLFSTPPNEETNKDHYRGGGTSISVQTNDMDNDYGYFLEPVLERRMTERTSNGTLTVPSRDISESDFKQKKQEYGNNALPIETDYLLEDLSKKLKKHANNNNMESLLQLLIDL